MKITYDGVTMEGTPEEIKEMLTLMGAVSAKEATEDTPTFKDGDRVKALADGEDGDIKAGEVGTIDWIVADPYDDDPYTIGVETVDGYDYFRPQDLELVEEKSSYAPKAGDIVVITDNTNHSRNEVGDIGKVGYVGATTAAVDVPDKPDSPSVNGNLTKFSEMRPATVEEKAKYEQSSKFAKLGRKLGEYKNGDIVRISGESLFGADRDGEIGEYLHTNADGDHCVQLGDKKYLYRDGQIELIAPGETRVDLRVDL